MKSTHGNNSIPNLLWLVFAIQLPGGESVIKKKCLFLSVGTNVSVHSSLTYFPSSDLKWKLAAAKKNHLSSSIDPYLCSKLSFHPFQITSFVRKLSENNKPWYDDPMEETPSKGWLFSHLTLNVTNSKI